MKTLLREHQTGLADNSLKLWNILMLAAWDMQRRDRKEAFRLRNVAPAASVV